MTPIALAQYARQKYNAVGDTFFSDTELFGHIYDAQMQLATEANCIRRIFTATTVIGQQEYSKPTNTIMIKRVTYDGQKLHPYTMREDDAVTLSNQSTTNTGYSQYYFEWDTSIFLRPVPESAVELKIFSYNMPQEVTSNSTLEVPTRYHLDISIYLLAVMTAKDRNYDGSDRYMAQWQARVAKAKAYERKMLRGDSFSVIQDWETLPITVLGTI